MLRHPPRLAAYPMRLHAWRRHRLRNRPLEATHSASAARLWFRAGSRSLTLRHRLRERRSQPPTIGRVPCRSPPQATRKAPYPARVVGQDNAPCPYWCAPRQRKTTRPHLGNVRNLSPIRLLHVNICRPKAAADGSNPLRNRHPSFRSRERNHRYRNRNRPK